MKTESKSILVIPYGLPKGRLESFKVHGMRISNGWKRPEPKNGMPMMQLWVTLSHLMDDRFVRAFHEKATTGTRLLVLNDRTGSDTVASRLIDLQIRTAHRFYVAEGKNKGASNWDYLQALLGRLSAAHDAKDGAPRILDARLEDETLRVVSTNFVRLDVPIFSIAPMARAEAGNFEIDEEGAYLYWPDLDLHIGWEQLQQIVDPLAVQKAKQKSHEFNVRYGAAIRKVREQKGLAVSGIAGFSQKQVGRIERGESRLTSNAAGKLARAHGLTPNEYLRLLASAL